MKRSNLAILLVSLLLGLAPGAAAQDDEEGRGTGIDRDRLMELIEATVENAEKRKPSREMSPVGTNAAKVAARLKRTLDGRKVTVNFAETPFSEALDFLRDVTGLNIVLSREAREACEEKELSLRLRKVKLRSCLELMLEQVDKDLRYGVRHGVLWIGLKDEWPEQKVLRFYYVEDIVRQPPDFPAPRLGLKGLTE